MIKFDRSCVFVVSGIYFIYWMELDSFDYPFSNIVVMLFRNKDVCKNHRNLCILDFLIKATYIEQKVYRWLFFKIDSEIFILRKFDDSYKSIIKHELQYAIWAKFYWWYMSTGSKTQATKILIKKWF